jgi:hypothetical protein
MVSYRNFDADHMRRAGEEANLRLQLTAKRSKPKMESTQNKQLRAKARPK